eukprot:SAG11_NODE_746_length_7383_cov_3.809995_3_plen_149_part_00
MADISLEFLRSENDELPYLIVEAADQSAGLHSWSVPELSLSGALPSDSSLPIGSDYFLRASRPQGLLGRRVMSMLGPLVLAGNMAMGGTAGATSWNSLSEEPRMAVDGLRESVWSNECEMGVGGSSGAGVGEVLQVTLLQPVRRHQYP